MLRYLRFAPQMWRSDVNDAVIDLVDPQAANASSTSAPVWEPHRHRDRVPPSR